MSILLSMTFKRKSKKNLEIKVKREYDKTFWLYSNTASRNTGFEDASRLFSYVASEVRVAIDRRDFEHAKIMIELAEKIDEKILK